jgi:hypothetical protein
MRRTRFRPWRRLASLRAGRRRLSGLQPPELIQAVQSLPPLEPPEDDREFAPGSGGTGAALTMGQPNVLIVAIGSRETRRNTPAGQALCARVQDLAE